MISPSSLAAFSSPIAPGSPAPAASPAVRKPSADGVEPGPAGPQPDASSRRGALLDISA